jgi:hypothetical protein
MISMLKRSFIKVLAVSLLLVLTACVPAIPELMNGYSAAGTARQLGGEWVSALTDDQTLPAFQETHTGEVWHESNENYPIEHENGQILGDETPFGHEYIQASEDTVLLRSENGQTTNDRKQDMPLETAADELNNPYSSSPDKQETTIDNDIVAFYVPVLETVSGHSDWYQSMHGNTYSLFFGQTEGMGSYVGKPVIVFGKIVDENLGVDKLYKHLPIEVHSFREPKDNDESRNAGEYVTLTGMMELQVSGNLILHSIERGDILLQTQYSDYGDDNFLYLAEFSGYLYRTASSGCLYLLIVNSYSIVDYTDGSNS